MIWFWTSPAELMDEEQGLMAALIRTKWLCALIKYLGWCRRGRQNDMLWGFLLSSSGLSLKSQTWCRFQPELKKKRKKISNTNNISNKWDYKKIKHFYFLLLSFLNVLNLHQYHLSRNSITRPVYKKTQ